LLGEETSQAEAYLLYGWHVWEVGSSAIVWIGFQQGRTKSIDAVWTKSCSPPVEGRGCWRRRITSQSTIISQAVFFWQTSEPKTGLEILEQKARGTRSFFVSFFSITNYTC
jgi:hypothetical protein